MPPRRVAPLAVAVAVAACATHAPSPPGSAAEEPPVLQLPEGVRPLRYALDLEIVPARDGFRGEARIEVELGSARSAIWMHGRGLEVEEARVEVPGAAPLRAEFAQVNGDGLARLSLPRPVGPGRVALRLRWRARFDRNVVGLYASRRGADAYASTQLETIFARRVFPCFDEPRFKTPFDVTLAVPAGDVAVSNAAVASEEPAKGGLRRVRFATTEPLPTYLVHVGVGPFDVVTPAPLPPNEVRRRPLPVRGLAPRGHGAELAFALEVTAALVPWFEGYFGIPFPYPKLDQIAVPELAFGAMENAGAIAYREALLLATARTSQRDRQRIAGVVAHEVGHQWFGDLVTLPWWTDAWLNESFATWIATRAIAAWQPGWSARVDAFRRADAVMASDSVAASRAVRQPLRAMAEVGGQFDGLSYQKGAAVLAGFERLVGEETFRDGLRAYLGARLHGTGSSAALFAEVSRAAGRNLAPALAGFTDRPGVPLVSARVVCGGAGARLLLSQRRWLPRGSDAPPGGAWQVPVCARWESGGEEREGCTLLGEAEGALDLGAGCPAWVLPHAGAVGYYRWALAPADLARLCGAGIARLAPAEKVSLARNLRAAQQAGAVPWGDAMGAIAALAGDPDPDAAQEPADVLALVDDRLVAAAARPAVAAFAARLYRPVLSRTGWEPAPDEAPAVRSLRAAAVRALAFTARDPEVRREAARRGAALAGLGGDAPRPDAVDPDLAEDALGAAVAEGGPRAFDALVARLGALEDATLRAHVVAALGGQDDPALARRAAALWRAAEVRPHELRYLLEGLEAHSAGRAALLGEVERDFEGLAAALPGSSLSSFPGVFAEDCDAATAARVRAALEPRLDAHPQMRRALLLALARIRVCAAEREADGAAAAVFFGRATPGAAANLPVDTAAPRG